MSHRFLPEARTEYLEAVSFYETRQRGLGAALIAEVERAIALAVERPAGWRLVHPVGIRKLGLARFPYTLFYMPVPDGIEITALAHDRQKPLYWAGRMKAS